MSATGAAAKTERLAGRGVMLWGVLLIVAGIMAILRPGVAALATELLLGWLFVLAGIVELVYAFSQRADGGFAWKLTVGLLTLAVGLALLVVPGLGAVAMALMIGAFMLASGVASAMLAFRLRPQVGWGWVLFDAFLSVALSMLVASGWPDNSMVFVGILVGVCLISGGIWRIMLGRALRAAGS